MQPDKELFQTTTSHIQRDEIPGGTPNQRATGGGGPNLDQFQFAYKRNHSTNDGTPGFKTPGEFLCICKTGFYLFYESSFISSTTA